MLYYKYKVYSDRYPNLPFDILGYNMEEDKMIIQFNKIIKEYKITYDNYSAYFSFKCKKYYLDYLRFQS